MRVSEKGYINVKVYPQSDQSESLDLVAKLRRGAAAALLATIVSHATAPASADESDKGTGGGALRLDPLVVTATRTETPLSQVGSALTVITGD